MKMLMILAVSAFLSGCATAAPVEVRYKTITVTKRGPCPDEKTYAHLQATRPVPLRNQPRPANGAARVAKSEAQLGAYEAEGKWADQVSAALSRCQIGTEETEESEGVADGP